MEKDVWIYGKPHPFAIRVSPSDLAGCHPTRPKDTLMDEWLAKAGGDIGMLEAHVVRTPSGKVQGGIRWGVCGVDAARPRFDPVALVDLLPSSRDEEGTRRVFVCPPTGTVSGDELSGLELPLPCLLGQMIRERGADSEYPMYFDGDGGLVARDDAPVSWTRAEALSSLGYLLSFTGKRRVFVESVEPHSRGLDGGRP